MENFAAQDASYRESVLPASCRARVAVEAASPLGWHEWVGDAGEIIAMETFGASAPAGALYKHFGFTPERVADVGREVAGRARSG
jgi:transketolase